MKFIKTTSFKILSAVGVLCIIAGIFFAMVISEKNSLIKSLESSVANNVAALNDANSKISGLESDITDITNNNSSIKSELDSIRESNDTLSKENASLKQENDTLKDANEQLNTSHQDKAQSNQTQSGEKICYLTFDDGPSENTLKILEILKKYNAKATFFVVGTAHLEYLPQIHAAGHTVGLHSDTHRYDIIYKSTDAYFKDLKALSDKVKTKIGIEPKVMRFPGGSSNIQGDKYCKGIMKQLIKQVPQKGYFYFDWNVDSLDASGKNVSYTKIRDSVLTSATNKNSICVLMHDTEAKDSTVTALPEIIEGLRKQGYVFKALTTDSYGYRHRG